MAEKVEQKDFLDKLTEARWQDRTIKLKDATIDSGTAIEPHPKLVESVARFGVLFPILVRAQKRGKRTFYRVKDGRRRVLAAEDAGLTEIPARILLDGSTLTDSVVTLQANTLRASNPVAELRAIEAMIKRGATERDLAAATGLSLGAVRRRLRLQQLAPELRSAWEGGHMPLRAAEAASRLDTKKQKRLVKELQATGKLTVETVKDARKVGAAASADALDSGVFAAPEKARGGWKGRVRDLLDEAARIAEGKAVDRITEVRNSIK